MKSRMMDFLSMDILGHHLSGWLAFFGVGIGLLGTARIMRSFLAKRFKRQDRHRGDNLFELAASLIERLSLPLMAILSIFVGSRFLDLSAKTEQWLSAIAVIAVIIQAARWGNALVEFWLNRYLLKQASAEGEGMTKTSLRAVGFVCRLVIIAVAVLLALDNIPGVEITALVASLGIGGIAVAIAVQNVLADLFASLSIVLDKPFAIDDFIIVDNHMGSVEYIGLKTTRLRSLSGEQLIFSNSDLLKSRIRNYKRMAERRVAFSIGVVYQTTHDKLGKIPDIIRQIIELQESVRFDRAHFQGFGESALNFEIVYYVLSPDYGVYMDIQQAINLAIYERFEQQKIAFAYPTRTLQVQTIDGRNQNGVLSDPRSGARSE